MSNGKMFEVPYGQNPYSAIGKYIRNNIDVIEDIIAVIELNGVETNELFMVDFDDDSLFVWKSDWWEGEEKVVLLDFFPVSEATYLSAEPRKGKWIAQNPNVDTEECSVCGYNILSAEMETPFCPWCGARMSEGEEND